ncbi:outer membrane lipoprotein carrier protein LolA [uncultured Acinetobacter sp.]|uniref:LolA family protein n=1 Tax=uncultured Acinetobacter sp. TaxID=165433 RepID=UPI0025872BBD|nr:outer membrane lipoprotein carrier protein LolA [uncultured Acinetobacter sp.]
MNIFISVFAVLWFMLPAHAATPQSEQIFKQLSQTSLVRAQFEQQKKLASLNKTFVSNGTVVFSKTNGVLWQLQRPVQADLIVTPKKLVQKTAKTMSQLDVTQSPYGSVATLFLQLMSGNQAVLDQHFSIAQSNITPQGWSIRLMPKSTLFKKLFVRIDIQGQQYVNQIVILEQGNNSTTINFSQQRSQPVTLSANEQALFQLAK